ncbi:hypothetical protein TEA_029212 [Camellia sinensis var. sinensis]|uniref:Protein kinase domain-containing protein n=1 Tax=Camellia sinensis var. sinensis TaxID=542762 RepID=A0A4S4F0B1_CAMSN|nr:hypothetical protein TEA_029212 [Camellia sinensis var. sinensis]
MTMNVHCDNWVINHYIGFQPQLIAGAFLYYLHHLDAALMKGLEYIHEHTVPVYIHRDIKSANILIDKNYRGKVANFGLTKLAEVGSTSLPTRLVGTFGYMPPEGSPKLSPTVIFSMLLREGPLPWSTRVQIALDSARGLEYIHEHTVPVYIHRDIKSANILIDKNYRGKVADFGLTKLAEVGSTSLPTRLVGTFGYMPPEYAQYGDVSPKIDVYAFGVVLYELISAKEAIVKASESMPESRGLVGLFDEVLTQPDPGVDLPKLVDPRLGDNYPLDSVRKMAQLAKACTQENPQLRPSMRSIVVALMTLSSTTEDWDIGAFYENQTLVNLMSGR